MSGRLLKLGVVAERVFRTVREFFQDQWFDRSRCIHTAGNMHLVDAGITVEAQGDSEMYQPARPAHVRQALCALPVADLSEYSYIDLGSGKGRTLFIAAEWPFRQVLGVEFTPRMQEQAQANMQTFRSWKRRSGPITSIYQNAAEFEFPSDPLVLYMFNPFGANTMQKVLNNLQYSLWLKPRHVFIILLWPQCADQVARVEGMRLIRTTRRHQIFEAHAAAERHESKSYRG